MDTGSYLFRMKFELMLYIYTVYLDALSLHTQVGLSILLMYEHCERRESIHIALMYMKHCNQ